jgi:DNA-binding transcriptional LysR family regulator
MFTKILTLSQYTFSCEEGLEGGPMLDDIRALVELADAGSVVKAADQMFLTPSAVTRKLQRLEAALQVTLLDRSVKPPRLTPLGRRILDQGRDVLRRVEDLKASASTDGEPRGPFRLGVAHALVGETLVEPVRRLTEQFPKLQLRIMADITPALFERLQRGELDAALALMPAGRSAPDSLQIRPVAEDDMMVVASKKSRAPSRLALHELRGRNWILNPPGCQLRAALLDALKPAGESVSVVAEMHNFHLQLAFVAAGHGWGFVPARFLRNHPRRRELRAIRVAGVHLTMIAAFVQAGRLGSLDCAARGLEAELAAQFANGK